MAFVGCPHCDMSKAVGPSVQGRWFFLVEFNQLPRIHVLEFH